MRDLKPNTPSLQAFWQNSPDIMIEFDADWTWVAINPAGAHLFHCEVHCETPDRGEETGPMALPHAGLTSAQSQLAQAIVAGAQSSLTAPQSLATRHTIAAPAGYPAYDFTYTPIWTDAGGLGRVSAVGRPLLTPPAPPTAPPPAAIAPPSPEFLAQLLDDLPQGIFWKDPQSVYQWCNRQWAEIVGVEHPADLIGKTDQDLPWAAAEINTYRDNEQAVMRSGQPQLDLLTSRQFATGAQRWFSSNKLPTRNAQGEITGILCTFEPISEQRRSSELKESQELLQLVLDNIPQLLFWKDRGCAYLGCNRNWAEAAGIGDPEAVVGKADADIWSPVEAELYRSQDEAIMASGVAVMHLVEQQQQADKVAWIEVNKIPIRDAEGNVIGLLGTIEDITERKQAEVALVDSEAQLRTQAQALQRTLRELKTAQVQLIQTEKMSGLGQLVAGVAHEINNPVNFIHGNITHAQNYTQDLMNLIALYQQHYPQPPAEIIDELEAIEIDFIKTDLKRLLQSMLLGTERIRKIVLSLRNFSRLDEAEVKDVDIIDGIDSTLTILHGRLKFKSDFPEIQIVRQYGEIPRVNCYAGQLNQVFMNILANAIDALNERDSLRSPAECYAQPSTITITTTHLSDRDQGDRVCIQVHDNGPGIPKLVRDRIFDPFYTTKAVGKGTGLGLSISYQIVVERHGGQLTCTSTPDHGTEFCIEIPVK